jgi:hypothetical protein
MHSCQQSAALSGRVEYLAFLASPPDSEAETGGVQERYQADRSCDRQGAYAHQHAESGEGTEQAKGS